jgi:dienelactone hydrolase
VSRFALGIALLASIASSLRGEDLTVLGDEPKMLRSYLLAEAQKHFDARRKVIAELKTPDDVHKRQSELKARFIEALGGFPEKTALNAKVVGKENYEGYSLERVIYESRPDHHVTAVLYLPEGKPPFPGVLMPCGHSANGKAAEGYQRAGILLAKNGLAVLCYDPIGQGERLQLLDKDGKSATGGGTTEHDMVGVGALLVGSSTATYRIWDGIRSLDYLAGRPDIDPKRLGCTGNSGGGTLAAYLMALDDRIAVAAPSCYITSLERLFATIGPQDAEQNITGQVAFGMEHADYITLRAPKPTLICTATQDFFDIDGAWTSFREAKRIYALMGNNERLDMIEYSDKHGFSKPRREAVLRWMRRWLMQIDDAPTEGDFSILKDDQLQCTRTGQVLEDFKGKSVFDLNALEEKALAKTRRKFQDEHGNELSKGVRLLIGVPRTIARAKPIKLTDKAEIERKLYVIKKQLFETEPGIKVPALRFEPAGGALPRLPLIVYVHSGGKHVDAGEGGEIERLVKQRQTVLAVDLRGWGETAPGNAKPNKPNYFGVDEAETYLGLHLSRPLLGQRTLDLLAVIAMLKEQEPNTSIQIIGVDNAGPVVLHAAALDSRIDSIVIRHGLASWSDVVMAPISMNQLTNVVPGALKTYDLPDLAATLAPRPLTLMDAVDGQDQVLPVKRVNEEYAGCIKAYQAAKAEESLRIAGER